MLILYIMKGTREIYDSRADFHLVLPSIAREKKALVSRSVRIMS